MGWGFDFTDIGDLLSDLGSSVLDVGSELISEIELEDALAIGTVGASVYFQNEQLKQSEKALDAMRQDALDSMAEDPISLADAYADEVQVDIGESDIVTDEDVVKDEAEKKSNVGKVRTGSSSSSNSATPKNKGKSLLVPQKLGVTKL